MSRTPRVGLLALVVVLAALLVIRALPFRQSPRTIDVQVPSGTAIATAQPAIAAQAKPDCHPGPRWQVDWFGLTPPSFVTVRIHQPVGQVTVRYDCASSTLRGLPA